LKPARGARLKSRGGARRRANGSGSAMAAWGFLFGGSSFGFSR
jgi:hypothetical protein